jgi:hypothetical protein
MTHAATMDLGRNAQTKQSGNRLPVAMLTLALIVATIAAVWFASRAGVFDGAAAKPAVLDRSLDQIEAQRGLVGLTVDRSAYLNGILDGAHATPFAATQTNDLSSIRRGYAIEALPAAKALPGNLSSDRRGYQVAATVKALPDNSPARRRIAARAAAAALRAQPDNLTSARRGYPVAAAPVSLPDNVSSARRGYPVAAQTGAPALPDNVSSARRGYPLAAAPTINLWSWRGHATGAATLPDAQSLRGGYWVQIAAPSFSPTSGTFHLGR